MPAPAEIHQITRDYEPHANWMIEIIQRIKPQHILELGTDVGDSARIFLAATEGTDCRVTTVDVKDVDTKWADGINRITFVKSDTRLLFWPKPIDVLFIDDHVAGMDMFTHVWGELQRFGVWVRKGGVIILHDTNHQEFGDGIRRAIRMWCLEAKLQWTEDLNGYGMSLIEVSKNLAH